MPIPIKFRAPFFPGCDYHLLFRSIDGVQLFNRPDDRLYYLRQFVTFFQPVANCLAYSLLDNHSHFVIRVKREPELIESIALIPQQFRTKSMLALIEGEAKEIGVCSLVERQVNSFMTSYAKAINKIHARKGGLFQSPFRRIRISSEQHLQQSIIYTHANAQKHGLVSDFKMYPFTSYHEIVSGKPKFVDVGLVLNFFGGKENFIRSHSSQTEFFYTNNWTETVIEKEN